MQKTNTSKITNVIFIIFCIALEILLLFVQIYINGSDSISDSYKGMRIFCMTLLQVILALDCFLFQYTKIDFWKIFAITFFSMGLVYMLIIPLYNVPDEGIHLNAAYYVSDCMMGKKTSSSDVLYRETDSAVPRNSNPFSREEYVDYYSLIHEKSTGNDLVSSGLSTVERGYYSYFIPALGITLGRLFGMNGLATLLLGRLFNLIFATCILSIVIKITPIFKELFFVISLMPIMLQQMMSYSQDVMLIPFSFLCIAVFLKVQTEKQELTNKLFWQYFAVMVLCEAIVIEVKSHAYILFLLLPLYSLISRFCSKKQKKVILWIVLGLIILGILAALAIIVYAHYHEDFIPDTKPIVAWAGEEGYSIGFIVHNPRTALNVFLITLKVKGEYYFVDTLVGASLGNLHILLTPIYKYIYVILMLAACINSTSNAKISVKIKIMFVFINILTMIFIYVGMMISWSPKNMIVILGVQGRYFIPILPMLLILLYSDRIKKPEFIDKFISATAICSGALTVTNILI